jgi:hypothetical protein
LVAHFIHKIFGQVDTQAPDSAFFNGAFQVRRFRLRGVKRHAVIFNIKDQFIILEGDRNPDGMFIFVVKTVGNDVGEQFIKRQVGFKDTFFGQAPDKLLLSLNDTLFFAINFYF